MNERELLAELLATAVIDEISPELRDRINEFVADYGGCAFCDRPAELLCDFPIGQKLGGWLQCSGESAARVGRLDEYDRERGGLPCIDFGNPETYTCDAPLCHQCAKFMGNVFWDGEWTGHSRIDFCPVHHDKRERLRPMEPIQAERERLRAWKMRIVSG